jgi:hypothetical protein
MGAMAYVPCPSCRFLIGPEDTTCRWCKVDIEEARAAKTRLRPPAAGAKAVDFTPGKKRLLGRAAKAPKEPKPEKVRKADKQQAVDIDTDALRPKKRAREREAAPAVAVAAAAAAAPLPVPPVPPSPPVAPAAPAAAAAVLTTAPVVAPMPVPPPAPVAAPIPPPAPVITAAPVIAAAPVITAAAPAPVEEPPATEMSVFARLAAPDYLPAATTAPLVEGYVAPLPVIETTAETVTKPVKAAKAPRERRLPRPGQGAWKYKTAALLTLGFIAASMATASYVLNRPTATTATTVATTVVPTTAVAVVPTKWTSYAAPDGSFTVEMPLTPTVKTAPSASDPTITETTYDAIAGGTALKVTAYPHAIDASQIHDLLQSFKNSALTVQGSTLLTEQETTISGRPALTYTVAQTDATLFFTEIFDADRVYTLVSALGADDSVRFLSSLVIAPHVAN